MPHSYARVEFLSKQLQSSCSASWDHVAVVEFALELLSNTEPGFSDLCSRMRSSGTLRRCHATVGEHWGIMVLRLLREENLRELKLKSNILITFTCYYLSILSFWNLCCELHKMPKLLPSKISQNCWHFITPLWCMQMSAWPYMQPRIFGRRTQPFAKRSMSLLT